MENAKWNARFRVLLDYGSRCIVDLLGSCGFVLDGIASFGDRHCDGTSVLFDAVLDLGGTFRLFGLIRSTSGGWVSTVYHLDGLVRPTAPLNGLIWVSSWRCDQAYKVVCVPGVFSISARRSVAHGS
jgi:hypothetical protein